MCGHAARRFRRQYQVFLRVDGERRHLWRAIDQQGVVLDILVQDRRNASAAKRFFRLLLIGLEYRQAAAGRA